MSQRIKRQPLRSIILAYLCGNFAILVFRNQFYDGNFVERLDFIWVIFTCLIGLVLLMRSLYLRDKQPEIFYFESNFWFFLIIFLFVAIQIPDLAAIGSKLYVVDTNFFEISLFCWLIWLILENSTEKNKNLFFKVASLILSVMVLLGLVQTSKTVIDRYHFSFTLDEMLSWSAGKVPFVDYFPQYSSLLGLPLAVFNNLLKEHVLLFPLALLIAYQVIIIGIAILTIFKIGTGYSRYLAAVGILASPLFTRTPNIMEKFGTLNSPSTYFASFPMRTFFPTVLLVVVLILVENKNNSTKNNRLFLVISGILIGLTIINNLDFGLPAAVAVYISLFSYWSRSGFRQAFYRATRLVFISILTIGAYFLFIFNIKGSINLSGTLGFITALKSGFVPMPILGIHTTYVLISLILIAISSRMLVSKNETNLRLAAVSLYWSLFSIFSLPYFAGRSYLSTFIGGYIFNFAVLLGLVLIWILENRATFEYGISTQALAVFCLSVLTVLVFHVPKLPTSYLRLSDKGNSSYIDDSGIPSKIKFMNLEQLGDVSAIYSRSGNAISILTGVKDLGITNDPANLSTAQGPFEVAQCESLLSALQEGKILVDKEIITVLPFVEKIKSCTGKFEVMEDYSNPYWVVLKSL